MSSSGHDSALSFETRLDLSDSASYLPSSLFLPRSGRFNRKQNTTSVHQLLLRRNGLDSIEIYQKALSQFKHHLTELSLRENHFSQFPPQVLMFEHLVSLSLAHNVLMCIETGLLSQLTHLQWLNLGHNRLEALPADLFQCRELRGLNLENNQFTVFPSVLCYLTCLEILMLQKNKIDSIPSEYRLPKTLHTLNLAFNKLTCVPDTLVYHPPPQLTHLHLSGNSLEVLPLDFLSVGYRHLVSLDLHTCHLTELSELFCTRLAECKQFKRLNLAINQLKKLSSAIGKLTGLQWLNLNDNQIQQLPSTMANLTELVKLGLVQNQIKSLPPFMFLRMLQLQKLDIRRNQIKYMPSSILALAPKEEITGHQDLAVPHSVFYTRRHAQGGSLKTLLMYENSNLESLDGILAELDTEDNRTVQLACLAKAYETLAFAASTKEGVRLLRQSAQKPKQELDELDAEDQDQCMLQQLMARILPLKEMMLRSYLTQIHPHTEQPGVFPKNQVPFLIQSFAERFAQQCDHCDGWYTWSSIQLGYLTRLCNDRLQVPVRFQLCSIFCAVEAVMQLQQTSLNWQHEKKSIDLDTPTLELSSTSTRSFRDRVAQIASSILNTRPPSIPVLAASSQREPPAIMSLATRIVECILQTDEGPTRLPLSTPTPNPTGFNHLPRDAIRLERF